MTQLPILTGNLLINYWLAIVYIGAYLEETIDGVFTDDQIEVKGATSVAVSFCQWPLKRPPVVKELTLEK